MTFFVTFVSKMLVAVGSRYFVRKMFVYRFFWRTSNINFALKVNIGIIRNDHINAIIVK